ncbi:hypothetical protein K2173_022887 [Erythroxylum novogranatense]|uniref:Exostosin GT47 domain-containing protein n=1 Tax=Erythroxylum novogranatense TaxID=1862640 RepID=A0AAV8TWT4_9ROSI|nr:hypothetical protein K2173_022887 [Erythroxylum novogranatense]
MQDRGAMESVIGKGRRKFWYLMLASCLLWLLLIYMYLSALKVDEDHASNSGHIVESQVKETRSALHVSATGNAIDNFFIGGDWDKYLEEASKTYENSRPDQRDQMVAKEKPDMESAKQTGVGKTAVIESNSTSGSESCSGRYIYIYDLPSRFNDDLLKNCKSLNEWYNMCPYVSNNGLGPKLNNFERELSDNGWFETNQFTLEVIFHNRMKQYNCLTNDSSLASAIFVPYYAGLDIGRYLWHSDRSMRDRDSNSLVKWLRKRPEWKKLWGRDHFMVAGRITWDFRRLKNWNNDWGNRLMLLPESRNMTVLTIEASPWHRNDFAIPYPTYFHPATDEQVLQWQNKMRRSKRRILFSFAGAQRPNMTDSIRGEIIKQCQAAKKKCRLLDCTSGSRKCYEPTYVMKLFQSSVFCLQPPGDSMTRRSIFDSILAGCIPVFFHPGSGYVQYIWYFPKDHNQYSVFISAKKVRNQKVRIESLLSRITKTKIMAMREMVIKLIPGVIYADPASRLENLEDAFDITIDGVLVRIERIRKDIEKGENVSDDDWEEFTWKKSLFGTIGKHEWDPFFARKENT